MNDLLNQKKKFEKRLLIIPAFLLFLICAIANNRTDSQSTQNYEVANNAFDSSVWQVKEYLKSNLNDAGSVEYVSWSPVVKSNDGSYLVKCKYRAKNGFGAYILKEELFQISSNGLSVNKL